MNAENGGKSKRTEARRLHLVVEGDRMTMRPSRFGLALGLGALAGILLLVYGLVSAIRSEQPNVKPSRTHATTPAAPPIPPPAPPTFPAKPVELTPLVPIGHSHGEPMDRPNDRVEDDPLAVRILKAPWSPIVLGFCVFWITSFLFHERIVLDRGLDVLTRGGRVVCKLSEVTKVELEDYFRIRVMNGMALLLSDGRRFSLLLYDGRADDGLKAAAQQVAEFAGASVEFKVGGSLFRDKKK